MSIRRWNRRIKPLAEKGKPGAMLRRIVILIDPATGRKRQFHPNKGWRRFA